MRRRTHRREGGFALLLVLWSLGLLALIGTQVTATGRAEAMLAANLRTAAVAEAAADGAVHQAIFRLLAPEAQRWPADGPARELALPGGATALLRIESDQGKLNPNLATAPLLQALLLQLGAEPRTAGGLAGAILDWRTAGLRPRPGGAKEAQYRAAVAWPRRAPPAPASPSPPSPCPSCCNPWPWPMPSGRSRRLPRA
jgi:general secretion pathway protein K